jgi:hypothetical protein
MPPSEQIPFEGVLNCWNDEHDLPDLLLAISRAGKTGRLHFSNPEGDKTLFIKEGRIVFAESSSDDDGLGPFLMRTGQISLMHYTRITKLVEPGKRLGALLVEHGALEPKELVPAVLGQVREVVLGLFRRTETWYRFTEETLPRKEAITLDMPVAQLIIDGVQYIESWRRISKGVGDLDAVYTISAAGRKEFDTVQIEGGVMELLEMLEEPVSLAEICEKATLPDFEACRYLWAFRTLDWIDRAELEAAEPVPAKVDPSRVITAPAVTKPSLEPAIAAAAADTPPTAAVPKTPEPSLVQTQIAMDVPGNVERPKESNAAEGPRPIPEDLVQTRIAVDPPAPAKPEVTGAPSTPAPPAPKPIPEHLSSTQLYMSHPSVDAPPSLESPTLPAGTTGDMMEAILEGKDGAPATPPSTPARSQPPPPPQVTQAPSPSADSTQLFDTANALESPEAEESYADFAPSGFEALAMGGDVGRPPAVSGPATKPSVSPPAAAPDAPLVAADEAMTSFGDLAYGDDSFENVKAEEVIDPAPPAEPFVPHAPEPVADPTVVDGVEVMEAGPLPTVEAAAVAPESETSRNGEAPSGMEALVGPTSAGNGEGPQFATDDPMNAPSSQDPPIPPPPKRRKTDDMDFDMDGLDHVFREN